jgi:hypothetical protein
LRAHCAEGAGAGGGRPVGQAAGAAGAARPGAQEQRQRRGGQQQRRGGRQRSCRGGCPGGGGRGGGGGPGPGACCRGLCRALVPALALHHAPAPGAWHDRSSVAAGAARRGAGGKQRACCSRFGVHPLPLPSVLDRTGPAADPPAVCCRRWSAWAACRRLAHPGWAPGPAWPAAGPTVASPPTRPPSPRLSSCWRRGRRRGRGRRWTARSARRKGRARLGSGGRRGARGRAEGACALMATSGRHPGRGGDEAPRLVCCWLFGCGVSARQVGLTQAPLSACHLAATHARAASGTQAAAREMRPGCLAIARSAACCRALWPLASASSGHFLGLLLRHSLAQPASV